MQDRTRAEIAACFNAFPQSRATDQDVFIATVMRDVHGLEDEAVIRACQAFTAGDVKGQNLDFAPAVPRFVSVCREMQRALEYSRVKRMERKAEIDDSPPCPPEKVQALADALAGKRTIQSVAEEYGISLAAQG